MLDSIFKYFLSFLCSVRRYGWIRFSFLDLEVETLRVAIFGCWFRARLLARLVMIVPAFEVLSCSIVDPVFFVDFLSIWAIPSGRQQTAEATEAEEAVVGVMATAAAVGVMATA